MVFIIAKISQVQFTPIILIDLQFPLSSLAAESYVMTHIYYDTNCENIRLLKTFLNAICQTIENKNYFQMLI